MIFKPRALVSRFGKRWRFGFSGIPTFGIGIFRGVSVFNDDVVGVCVRFPSNTHLRYRVLHTSVGALCG